MPIVDREDAAVITPVGAGAQTVHQAAAVLGSSLVALPAHGPSPERPARGRPRAGCERVSAIRAT